ncbi:MAG: hypothetical protein HYU67_05345 [Flavobacteriia bacterium]|nr:hypothetical protein [Flavobacteriia bacterium]
MKRNSIFGFILLSLFMSVLWTTQACKKKTEDPSILKVFVRDENRELLPDAKVIIIGDTKSNPPTIDYVDTMVTDSQGVSEFDLNTFFEQSGKATLSGYFNILVKYGEKIAEGKTRVKRNIVSVETVYFEP